MDPVSQAEPFFDFSGAPQGEFLIFSVDITDMPDHAAKLAEPVRGEPLAVFVLGIDLIHP